MYLKKKQQNNNKRSGDHPPCFRRLFFTDIRQLLQQLRNTLLIFSRDLLYATSILLFNLRQDVVDENISPSQHFLSYSRTKQITIVPDLPTLIRLEKLQSGVFLVSTQLHLFCIMDFSGYRRRPTKRQHFCNFAVHAGLFQAVWERCFLPMLLFAVYCGILSE